MSPFWANYYYHLAKKVKALKQPSNLKLDIQADTMATGLEETHQTFFKNMPEAQPCQTKYVGGKVVVFEVENMVWISICRFWTTKPFKKLDYKWAGPYTVRQAINENAYN